MTDFVLVLDSNVWVSERMLHSALGAATLHALIKNRAQIGLPEIVELEVNKVLLAQADDAVDRIQKSTQFLRQITGHQMSMLAPSREAVEKALNDRWASLSGVLLRVPFVMEHARAALNKIFDKAPPSGQNNEQFRDCCIWQCALDLAADHPVHLVTNDVAFYEGRNRANGIASSLANELTVQNREIHLYPHLNAFLGSMDSAIRTIDESAISTAIVMAVRPRAQEMAREKAPRFDFGSVRNVSITGYATPTPSVVAISFSVSFNLSGAEVQDGEVRQTGGRLRVAGGCSYDPNKKQVSDVEISEWSVSLDTGQGGMWGQSSPRFPREYSEGSFRII